MNRQTFLDAFGHIAEAPGGVDKLRRLILDLAVRGQLVGQNSTDEPAGHVLKQITAERDRLVQAKEIRRRKTLPEVGEEMPTAPVGWCWVRFGDLFSRMGAGSTPAGGEKSYVRNGVMFLRSQNVHNSGLVLDRVARISEAIHEKMAGTKVLGGDILLNITGASIGRSAIVPTGGWTTANVNQHVSVLRPLLGDTTEYIHLAIVSPYFQRLIAASSPGASREGLAIKRMELFLLPMPPLAEQQRIVEKVNQLMALCDELKEQQAARTEARSALTAATLHRVSGADTADDLRAAMNSFAEGLGLHLAPGDGDLAALKRIRQTLLDLAIRGRLTGRESDDRPAHELIDEVAAERDQLVKTKAVRKPKPVAPIDAGAQEFAAPEGWTWVRLADLVLSSDSGWSPACLPDRRGSEAQWAVLKVSAVSWGTFRAHEHKLLTPGLEPRPQLEVKDGDFIMSRANTAELVGRSVVASDPPPRLMLSDKHVRLRFRDRCTTEFANLVNGSTRARSYYAAVASGTSDSMRNITRDQILALPVMLPPLSEQGRIVSRVAELNVICDELEKQFETARTLRGALASAIAHATPGGFSGAA